jgi:hypothetical protein
MLEDHTKTEDHILKIAGSEPFIFYFTTLLVSRLYSVEWYDDC